MGTLSILQIAKDAALEAGTSQPSELVGNTGDGGKFLRFITKTCKQLALRDWEALRSEHTFTTIAAQIQTSGKPSDFLRIVDDTAWNRTERRPLVGPLDSSEWNYNISNIQGGIRDQFRFIGGGFEIYPAPAAGDTIAFEYIKNAIGTDSAGTTDRAAFAADTDLVLFDDELVTQGTLWRYKQSIGADYAEEYQEYQIRLHELYSDDGGKQVLTMGGSSMKARPIKPMFEDWGQE